MLAAATAERAWGWVSDLIAAANAYKTALYIDKADDR